MAGEVFGGLSKPGFSNIKHFVPHVGRENTTNEVAISSCQDTETKISKKAFEKAPNVVPYLKSLKICEKER